MPTRDTAWPDGTPCWIDYGASDLDGTKTFYADLLGWEYTGGEPEFGGYLTATRKGQQAAGLGPQQDPNDPAPASTTSPARCAGTRPRSRTPKRLAPSTPHSSASAGTRCPTPGGT